MPTYQYRCTECSADLEVVQKFTDDALTECPTCGGDLRKVFNAVGVVFKGSGFYKTDSRGSKSASPPASTPAAPSSSGDSTPSSSSAATGTAAPSNTKAPAASSSSEKSTAKAS